MTGFSKPINTITRINNAGKRVRNNTASVEDVAVIENWRAAHAHILNTWQSTLKGRIKKQNPKIIFAQRLKRRSTIFDKLKREPNMALYNMHDIAGCRLIFPNVAELESYRKKLHEKPRFKHLLHKKEKDPYNYIEHPTSRGYRGIHDVYTYKASREGGKYWDGLKVEIQYRTIKQHAWATAVEIAGSLTGNHSKFDRGSEDQKEFFRLASEIIARAHENLKSCYAGLTNQQLITNFQNIEKRIHLLHNLKTLTTVSTKLPTKGKVLILKSVHLPNNQTETKIYAFHSMPAATKKYFELEKEAEDNEDIVLVKSQYSENIRKAYQNYFSNTKDFVTLIEDGIDKLSR